jgi:putative transposase
MPFYHVWFATKNRKWLLDGDVAEKARAAMIEVASARGINVLELQTMVDHVHVLLEAPLASELSWFMKLIKGRSAYEVFRAFPELKIDAGVESLWQRSFNSRVVPIEQLSMVRRYIRTQDQRMEKYER